MFFFVKTHNPRPTFHLDMTQDERDTMQKHVAYWSEMAEKGISIVFGPVMDPKGVYGIGVFKTNDENEMKDLIDHDPAKSILRYEIFPMPRAVLGNGNG